MRIYAALHAPSTTIGRTVTPIMQPLGGTVTTSSPMIPTVVHGLEPENLPSTSGAQWSSSHGGRARRYRSTRRTPHPGRLHRTPVIGSLPRQVAAVYEDRSTRSISPIAGPSTPDHAPTTCLASLSARDAFMGHPDDKDDGMGE